MRREASAAISVKLSRKELLILRRLSFLARRTGGRKLSSNAILRALIGFMRRLDTDLEDVRSIGELKRRLLKAKLLFDSAGVTLVELVVTMAIITVAGLGLAGSFAYITKAVQTQRAKTLAVNLSQEQIESLKNKSYFSILPTAAPSYNTSFSPSLAYDPTYYPPKAISIGQNKFTRLTYVERVLNSGGALVPVSYDSLDTGLKRITVHTIWKLGTTWYKLTTTNLASNYSQLTTGGFSGTVSDPGGNPINEADVFAQEDAFQHDYTDASGKYAFAATPGAYSLGASAPGYYRQIPPTQYTITAGNIQTVNFTLTPMSSGSVSGAAYVNDHLLISQVVASSGTQGLGVVEYVELYNPTTYAWTIDSSNLELMYRKQNTGLPADAIILTFNTTILPSNAYYLIASTSPITAAGVSRAADAQYTAQSNQILDENDGGVGIRKNSSSAYYDRVAWSRPPGADPPSDLTETTAISIASGLGHDAQIVRYTSTGALNGAWGNAYDSDENSLNFTHISPITQGPRNSSDVKTPISGSPAYGAVVTANDGLSASTIAWRTTSGGFSYATFTLVGIATGSWTVAITSGGLTTSISGVSVLTQGADTPIPNSATSPAWAVANDNSSVLTSTTSNGVVSGRVTSPTGLALPNISVTVEPSESGVTNGQGYYSIPVPAGTYSVLANPNSTSAPSYGSSSLPAVTVSVGQFNGGNDLVLSGAGRVAGYVCNYSTTNPYPGVTVTATDINDNVRGEVVSGSDGRFTISNLSTGTYTIRPVLETGQTTTPTDQAASVTTGNDVSAGTFTVTGAYGVIAGSVTKSGSLITTGVLIVATTGTIAGSLPPTISTGTLSGAPYYMASAQSDGTFTMDVRVGTAAATFNLYGWYTTYSGDVPNTPGKQTRAVTVTGGQTTNTGLQW
ncbi:MAG: carboxypeptidase regulatory-like domain-containing protein [Elusimicrobia bacterium]|nr:carboxypeptidase regulatory-like domain-containing protein [Elusimicrobiota bacterium]